MDRPGRVLKIKVSGDPVLLKGRETVAQETETEASGLVETARRDAERIRKLSIEAGHRDREAGKMEAARILEEAHSERGRLIAEEAAKAREAAREEVLQTFRPRIEQGVQQFEAVVLKAEQAWRGCLLEHRNEVVELALAIAEKIVRKISKEDEELVRRVAERALSLARERQTVLLRVNPDDLEVLSSYEEDLMARFEDLETFRVEEDRRVDRGGVWIETPSGFVDARIARQLEEIFAAVMPPEEKSGNVESPDGGQQAEMPEEEA